MDFKEVLARIFGYSQRCEFIIATDLTKVNGYGTITLSENELLSIFGITLFFYVLLSISAKFSINIFLTKRGWLYD